MPDSSNAPTTDGGSQPPDPAATRPGATSDAAPPGAVLLSQPLGTGSRDRYSVTRLHATGGLGRVWLAHDPGMNREVALKELLPERSGLPAAAARFVREARITGQLEHPGIVPVYELAGDATGAPFYTMRFVRGRTFGEAIEGYHQRRATGTAGPLELRELLAAFVTLCQAVAYAHSRRVIHRDLKPANVILGDFGEVILLDWGIAKVLGEPEAADPNATRDANAGVADPGDGVSATRYGQVLGTPAYMAPEQAAGALDQIDERTDVYGLGAVLYEIATGSAPFRAETIKDLLERVRSVPPARPSSLVGDVAKPLEAVILKCLSKAPPDRYASAKALAADVQQFLADEPVSAYRDPLRVRAGRWARRNRTLVAALSVLVLVAVPALLVALVLVNGARSSERDARVVADAARAEAEANFQKAVRSAEVVSEELARGIRPIAGTQSQTVVEILTRAEAVYDDLLASPNPPARARLNKAKMLTLVSDVYRGMARLRPATERAERAIEMSKQLVAEAPDAREYRVALAGAYHKRGWALWDAALSTKALADFDEAIKLFGAAGVTADADPDDAYAFASALTLSANVLTEFGDANTARERYRRGLELREALFKRSPNNPHTAMQLAISLERFGLFHLRMGEKPTGLAQLARAVELNEAAHAGDRGNSEFARSLIRALNSYGLQIVGTERPKALAHLARARGLAETFAKRDPDDNVWVREDLRAKWLAAELDKAHWIRLAHEQRRAARAELARLIKQIIEIAEKRIAEHPENGMWLADRSNLQGRLAEQLHESASAGDDPDVNRGLALGLARESADGYARLIATDPGSYENKLGLLYALWIAREILAAKEPNADALVAHWKYAKVSVETWAELYRKWPDHVEGVGYFRTALFTRVFPTGPLRENWLALSGEARVVEAMLDLAAVLPKPDAMREEDLRARAAEVREEMLNRLNAINEKVPLPARARPVLDSLK